MRESEGKAYSGVKSKIKGNMKVQNKVRTQSATLQARKAAYHTFAEQGDGNMSKLITDLNISYEELGCLPRRVNISPERADQFNNLHEKIQLDLNESK